MISHLATPIDRVGAFLARSITKVDWTAGADIVVAHCPVDGPSRTVRGWSLAKLPDEREFNDLVDEVNSEARTDSEQLGGMQRYLVRMIVRGREIGSISVRHNHDALWSNAGSTDSEPSSERGIAAQASRFAEAAIRLLLEGQATTLRTLENQLAQKDRAADSVMSKNFEILKILEATMKSKLELEVAIDDRRVQREVDAMQSVRSEDRKGIMFDKFSKNLGPILSIIGSRATGYFAPSLTSNTIPLLAHGFLQNLDDQRLQALQAVLTPAEYATLVELRRTVLAGDSTTPSPTPSPPPSSPSAATTTATAPPQTPPSPTAASAPAPDKPWPSHLTWHALLVLREGLIPWVITKRKTDPKINPTDIPPMQLDVLRRLMAGLTPELYSDYLSAEEIFPGAEREAFEHVVEILGLKPGVPSQPTEGAKTPT